MSIKIQLTDSDLQLIQSVVENPNTKQNPWLETNLACNLALYRYLKVEPKNLLKTPFVIQNKQKKNISIKSFSPDSVYPELKEYKEHKPFDLYVIAVYDSKKNIVWFDGWANYASFVQESNLYKNCYLMSYKDLKPMEELVQCP